jgi:WD40 repeat protein
MADPSVVLPAHEQYGLPLAFSSDGETLYTGGFDGSVSAWSVTEEVEIANRSVHEQSVNCGGLAGERLLSGSTDCTIRQSTVSLENTERVLEGHSKTVTDAAVNPDETMLASASYDSTVRIWDLDADSDSVVFEGHAGNVTCVEFLADGTRVAAGGLGGDVFVWNRASGDIAAKLGGHGAAVAGLTVENADRFWSVSYEGQVFGWTTADWSETASVDLSIDGNATGLAARPRGEQLAITVDGGVRILGTDGELMATHETRIKGILSPCWSPDGEMLAVGGADGKIRLYE